MSFVKRVTGPGVTERVNMVSADLGIVVWDPKRKAFAYLFGDNFAERYLRGEWQSPSIVMYDADHNLLGIPAGTTQIVESGNRRQALDYVHNKFGISTILPCDLMLLNGRWIMAAMIVGMGGLGDEQSTQFFESPDLVRWTKTGVTLQHHPPSHTANTMLSFDRRGDWVYTVGTGGLARDKPIFMWRSPAAEFPGGWFEPWGYDGSKWGWGIPNENSPILPGRYGELSFRFIQGNAVLSFFDVDDYCCRALTVPQPTDDWMRANEVVYARGPEVFQLYGGYICPDSQLNYPDGMKFIVSQWNTQSNDPYHVIAFKDTLQAKGMTEPPWSPPEPEPEPIPEVPVDPTTPQETYELLLRELAASGSTEILTADGRKLTLREAVGEIYAQECSLHALRGMPIDPRIAVTQLDHVLSSRFDLLFVEAVVVALADKMGVDAGKLYKRTKESLG